MLTSINQIGDSLTDRMATLIANDELHEEAIAMKAEYIEKLLLDGENVLGHTLESIAEIVLEDDLASKAMVTLFLYSRSSYFQTRMQDELSRIALEIAPKLMLAEQEY